MYPINIKKEDKYGLKKKKNLVSSRSLVNLFHKETELGISENLSSLVQAQEQCNKLGDWL